MRRSTLFPSLLALLPAGLANEKAAPPTTGNPQGAQYIAALPSGSVSGSVVASSSFNGTGVNFQISLSGLPSQGGPFQYHIHENPVASDGSCSSVGEHVDPYRVGDLVPCDQKKPQDCQVGDLSGKHGLLNATNYASNYIDNYVSTVVDSPAFVGSRSLVVHYSNKTIITCANFTMEGMPAPAGYNLGDTLSPPAVSPAPVVSSAGNTSSSSAALVPFDAAGPIPETITLLGSAVKSSSSLATGPGPANASMSSTPAAQSPAKA
ncbi:hypothetical protein LTR37_000609 [Vermiconidia calcicola]|uniref:Uncharacterized protein n=1 Tax=Vermiconidia calcicola TaxID=1690605 RepID=A0ACC3NY62_9PEZI|nr:hypothetical protein LTR37_000609 [Vermiconidia calcicola]